MATPVISKVEVIPSVIPVGGKADIIITASDPDAQPVSFVITVKDSSGNEVTANGSASIADPLSFGVTANVGTVTPDAVNPNVFHYQAP